MVYDGEDRHVHSYGCAMQGYGGKSVNVFGDLVAVSVFYVFVCLCVHACVFVPGYMHEEIHAYNVCMCETDKDREEAEKDVDRLRKRGRRDTVKRERKEKIKRKNPPKKIKKKRKEYRKGEERKRRTPPPFPEKV